ncbi:MAG: 50S ribosomal protein L31 [Candidatus Glassbacteria bacterium]|nr:50S ribosomal protein L31 [Candidatus Glassbacteria bacterium]
MKKKLHPEYKKCLVSCACGSTFETRSTIDKIHVEICSQCHPFYTGKQKLVDSAGRVELYNRRYRKVGKKDNAAGTKQKAGEEKKAKPAAGPVAAVESKEGSGDRAKADAES